MSHAYARRRPSPGHHKLTALRDEASDTATFRSLTAELVTLLAYEATREMRVQPLSVTTPVGLARASSWPGRFR